MQVTNEGEEYIHYFTCDCKKGKGHEVTTFLSPAMIRQCTGRAISCDYCRRPLLWVRQEKQERKVSDGV